MVHSDWGDWLPCAVAEADPAGLHIWYLGCNGFVLKSDEATVFVDPYLGTGDPPRTIRMIPVPFDPADVEAADAVLATHEHSDHVDGPSQAPILARTGATFFGPDASVETAREAGWTERWDVDGGQFTTVEAWDSVDLGDLTVTVTPANDPDAEHPVGYCFEHDAGTFFHGGDARPGSFAEVGERFDVDLAALAFGSVGQIPDKETRIPKRTRWYNDENQIVEAATELATDRLLPTHWDMWKGLTADPTALHDHVRSFDHPRTLEVVEIGDRISL